MDKSLEIRQKFYKELLQFKKLQKLGIDKPFSNMYLDTRLWSSRLFFML